MKNLIISLLLIATIALCACNGTNDKDYRIITRTALWEVRQVNDTTLIATPTSNNGDKPILFDLTDKETYIQITQD